ncbi:MAG: nodulation protein NfeD [Rhodothermales bacterium]|nr:nodulation protein NfeD [Rhodothermales bacterium]
MVSPGILAAGDTETPTVWVLSLEGPIGPAMSDYVSRKLVLTGQQEVSAVVLRIDTPGGLDSSMRTIIEAILASPSPVIGYVAPQGARAASAGTYILYSTHVAAMAPATTLGAATPVQLTPVPVPGREDPGQQEDTSPPENTPENLSRSHPTLADKAVSDAVAYIRGLAQLRGRNVDWAEQAVAQASSLPAEEALRENVVDLMAESLDELLSKVHGMPVSMLGVKQQLDTQNALVIQLDPDWRTELLATITNPTVAYVLLIIGIYGLIFEFWNPGSVGPGIIGAICLLLGLYSLQFLPVNYTGFALIILGVALMVAEAFVPSIGVLGLGGLVAFVAGSIMLLDTEVPGFTVSPWVIGTLATVGASVFLTVFLLMNKARHRPVVTGPEELLGSIGDVIDWQNGAGRIRTHGEVWQATAAEALSVGTRVRVAGRDGLVLKVEPDTGHAAERQTS